MHASTMYYPMQSSEEEACPFIVNGYKISSSSSANEALPNYEEKDEAVNVEEEKHEEQLEVEEENVKLNFESKI
jgi:hypothetical protein